MKKSLVLGAAALATLVMAAPQDSKAGEIKVGGYYMFRMQSTDSTPIKDVSPNDTIQGWSQRLQLNTDFIQDKTTHAHLVVRVLDSNVVQGADGSVIGGGGGGVSFASNAASVAHGANDWNIRKAWLETEAFGYGVKVGNMPIALNDNILVNNDDTGFGAIMFSKTFGNVTAVMADVKINEGNLGTNSSTLVTGTTNGYGGTSSNGTVLAPTTATYGAKDDDVDLDVIALFGKAGNVNYGVTGAYLLAGKDSGLTNAAGTPGTVMSDAWLALTLNTMLGGVDATATGIYENGMRGINPALSGAAPSAANLAAQRLDKSGMLGALRLKGDLTGMAKGSGWNAYALYSSENFTPITGRNPVWSKTWDMSGPGAQDLINYWTAAAGTNPESNLMAVGAGLTFVPAVNWTINPMLDYVQVVKDNAIGTAGKTTDYRTTSAWGGGVEVATKLNTATTLALTGL